MELITEELLLETQDYWNIPSKSLYHEAVSLIISQKISFTKSRQIRSKLYELLGSDEITYDNLREVLEIDLFRTGLDLKKLDIIFQIPSEFDIDDLSEINGIGIWTINALKIKVYPEKNESIFLCEDMWIRKHIGLLLDLNSTPSTIDVKKYISSHVPQNRSWLSRFLWRLKHTSIQKIKEGKQLTRDDFV